MSSEFAEALRYSTSEGNRKVTPLGIWVILILLFNFPGADGVTLLHHDTLFYLIFISIVRQTLKHLEHKS